MVSCDGIAEENHFANLNQIIWEINQMGMIKYQSLRTQAHRIDPGKNETTETIFHETR